MVGGVTGLSRRCGAQSPGAPASAIPLPLPNPLPAPAPFSLPTRPAPAPVPWGKETYSRLAVDRSLAELPREFAGDQGLNLILSPEVTKNDVRNGGSFPAQAPERFLNKVTRDNGLIW